MAARRHLARPARREAETGTATLDVIRDAPGLNGYLDAVEDALARAVAGHPGLVAEVERPPIRPAYGAFRALPEVSWEDFEAASRLAVEDVESGTVAYFDPLELSSLCNATDDQRREWLRNQPS